jgi:hypothetical protein
MDVWRWVTKRTIVLRRILQIFFVSAMAFLVFTSMLIAYLNKNISFTSVIARNCEATAKYLKNEPKLILLSDKWSLNAISFYRGFRDSDTLITFDRYGQLISKEPNPYQAKLVVINGPIYNIPQKNKKGWFAYEEKRKNLMDKALNSSTKVVFQSKFHRGILFERLVSFGFPRKLMTNYNYQLAQRLILREDAAGWVVVLEDINF